MLKKLEVQLPERQESTTESPNEQTPKLETVKAQAVERWMKTNAFFLPQRFKAKTLENFNGFGDKVASALKAIQSEKSVFLSGSCGTGKTHLACGLMYEWARQNIEIKGDEIVYPKRPIFLPAVEFFLQLKATFAQDSSVSEEDVISKYSAAEFLVLDDVGAEKISDWSRQGLYTLIDRRYRYMRPTIITSNLSLEEIGKQVDDRIASRIVEMGPVVNLGEKDFRLASAKA